MTGRADDQLSPLQRAVLTIRQLRSKLDLLEQARVEPIAIIGMGCRFPGSADSPDRFWTLLREGVDAIGEIPVGRWDVGTFYDPDPASVGKIYTRHGYFLKDVDQFDPRFFGLSPREANSLDPQHRLLLEVSWEALEDAGQPPDRLAGSRTGIFVGIGQSDYAQLGFYSGDPALIDTYEGTGNAFCFASGRLAHILGFQGPNLAVDTACSSSLVAVHLACQSLRLKECDLALAGGVQLILSPEVTVFLCRARALSVDGRCKTFDASADGYGRGEGCGMIALKRLSDALAAGDNILALIRGSAVNHNGSGSGLTVPSAQAQQALLQQALAAAGVAPFDIDYLEAHGTGTALGDPIEVRAIEAVFADGRSADDPLLIGSVKTNIGHLEAAAGIAGLIKVVLALEYGIIPANLHLQTPNARIPWDVSRVAVPRQPMAWPARGERRLAGVSSFGISGTNAHAVLEAAPAVSAAPRQDARPLHVFAMSAKSKDALLEHVRRMERHLAQDETSDIADICFSANAGRAHHAFRLALVCENLDDLRRQLTAADAAPPADEPGRRAGPIAWLFTGQGSQHFGMGGELYRTQPTFRRIMDECDAILRPDLSRSLLEVCFSSDDGALNETGYTQPALFALEYALAELWRSWGVEPAAVMGHSLGEFVAACQAGVFSLQDGLRLIAARGRLMEGLSRDGLMAAVMADEAAVAAAIEEYAGQVSVAAINGPRNTVISGASHLVEAALAKLARNGIAVQPLRTSHAFHSPLVEPMIEDFARVASAVRFSAPNMPLISNVSGDLAGADIMTPDYCCRHARNPVRFSTGVAALARLGCHVFLEIGPAPVLTGMGRQALVDEEALWLASLRPGMSDWRQMLNSLGQLYVRGASLDWIGFDRDYDRQRVRLPTYPFERRRYWVTDAGVERASTTVSPDWFYRLEWQPAPVHELAEGLTGTPGCWLILADDGGVGGSLGMALERQGHRCFLVYRKSQDVPAAGPTGPDRIPRPDFANQDGLRGRLTELQARAGLPLRGIIHLWALDLSGADDAWDECLSHVENEGCDVALSLVRALAGKAHAVTPRLWFVTRGAQPAGIARRLNVFQSVLWGLGKTIALEHPSLWGGLIDLDRHPSADDSVCLGAELSRPDGESQVAWRGRQRFVLRLVRCAPLPARAPKLRGDACYLVTGGLGFLGLEIALWLARSGARHLVLTGRSAPSPRASARIAEIEQIGAKLLVLSADVGERDDLRRLVLKISAEMPPLRGIFHAAGVVGHQPLMEMDLRALRGMLRPKVNGTWLLDQLTADIELDFFVCISSIASLWGAKGQAHYAAANQFLDAFAHDRRARGLPSLTANLGPWSGGGMASHEFRELMERIGISALPIKEELAALTRLIASELPQAAVVDVDWPIFKELYGSRGRTRLFDLIDASGVARETGRASARPVLLERLRQSASGQRHALVAEFLEDAAARILQLADGQSPNRQEGFFQAGMDSLMAMELRARLAAALGQELPANIIFDYPTIDALAGAVLALLRLEPSEPASAPSRQLRPSTRSEARDGIAIVGMACRFPGGADSPEQFWELLREGRDAICRVPAERWDADTYYDPDVNAVGKTYTQQGGFIDGIEFFDAHYFGITPREAADIDPQHRLLLEVSHAAIENAGRPIGGAADDKTGVFVGLTNNEYSHMLLGDGGEPDRIGPYYVTGNSLNAAAGRISYALGLRGPSMTVDTACSSSLVAVHLACRSLWDGECDAAIAAGVNLMLTPAGMVAACRAGMLSPDGRCKTFDAAADGYGRGEGCGVVVLKRLSEAIAGGCRVWAVIRGSAVNQDGRSGGFTVPNGLSQQAVIRDALACAGVLPAEVGHVEAHGTGTALGDPIEIGALGAVFGEGRDREPLMVGSVKANIGHLESAAGIAGLIKTALVLHQGELPRLPHLHSLNPQVPWDRLAIRPIRRHMRWPTKGRRIAGVSSFGVSGTNAHVVIEQAPEPTALKWACERPLHLLTISAKTQAALQCLAGDLATHLERNPHLPVGDVCFTVNSRTLHSRRAAWAVANVEEARDCLSELSRRGTPAVEDGKSLAAPKIAFVFAGEAAAHAGQASELYRTQPEFRTAIDKISDLLLPQISRPLSDVMFGEETAWRDNPVLCWSATFALEYALAELWQAWGMRPDIVFGLGVGEYVAACVAGVFSLTDGLRLALERAGCVAASGGGKADAARRSPFCMPPRIGFVSSASGRLENVTVAEPKYWQAPSSQPASMPAAIATLQREGCDFLLEMGSHEAWHSARQQSQDRNMRWLHSLERGQTPWRTMLASLAALYLGGARPDLQAIDRGYARCVVSLPGYPFQRRRYWLRGKEHVRQKRIDDIATDSRLTRRVHSAIARDEIEYAWQIDLSRLPFLADHRVFGALLLPSSVHLEMVLAAGFEQFGDRPVTVSDYKIVQAAIAKPEEERVLHAILKPKGSGYSFEIVGSDGEPGSRPIRWMTHATGTIEPAIPTAPRPDLVPSVQARLGSEMPATEFYDWLGSRSIDLGTRFRGLRRLWSDRLEALGEIALPAGSSAAGLRIHPVILDACFQTVGASLRHASEEATYLQVGIDRMTFHATPGERLWSHARLRSPLSPASEIVEADLALVSPQGNVIATIEGLRLKAAGVESGQLYEVQWHERALWPGIPGPAPHDMRRALLDRLMLWRTHASLARYSDAIRDIEAICAVAAARGLRELGLSLDGKGSIKTDAALVQLGVAPRYRRLFVRMLEILHEKGWVTRESGGWKCANLPGEIDLQSGLGRLREKDPNAAIELELLGRTLPHLADVLRGSCDPKELLFPGGDLGLLTHLYADSPIAAMMNSLVEHAIATAISQWPEGRKLRLLEIGGGTGATTTRLLPLVPPQSEYVFTDVADEFIQAAQHSFSGFAFLTSRLLNIEQDPAVQGFSGQQFDMIIAANALHATANLARTLQHVRRLLAPGGLLVLLEGTAPLRFLDLTFGLTEGWWRFAEDPARPNHCLISAEDWQALLRRNGFEEFSCVASEELAVGLPRQAVITARAAHAPFKVSQGSVGRWLVLADRGGVGRQLCRLLRARGAEIAVVPSEAAPGRAGSALETVADYRRLLDAADGAPLRGVVHLRSLDAQLAPSADGRALRGATDPACRSVLYLAQALLEAELADPPPLYLVTRGAVNATAGQGRRGDSLGGLAQTPVWGLVKILASEHEELQCRLVDLDPAETLDAATLLDELLHGEADEKRLAIRGGRRYVARLARMSAADANLTIRSDRSYLITGGLGDVGLSMARWLAVQGARHLVLLGRSLPSAPARAVLQTLQDAGINVLAAQCDVSNYEAVASVLSRVRNGLPTLAGVIHAAGVFADRLIVNQEWSLFEQVFAPKIDGAWNLHRLTQDIALDFFVLCSSASTLLGGVGLANYVAANEFLDGLAAYRRYLGLPGLSVDWGPWAGIGMAKLVGATREAEWRAIGMRPLDASAALRSLSRVLAEEASRVGVISLDWSRFRGHSSSAALGRFLDLLVPHAPPEAPVHATLRRELEIIPAGDRYEVLFAHVHSQVRMVMGWDQAEPINPRQGFFDLGMDSMQSNELRNRLQISLECALPPTLTFRFPTIAALTDHLLEIVFGQKPPDPSVSANNGAAAPLAADEMPIESMPPSTIEAAIGQELTQLERLLEDR
jgi:malonyl CoA-acyl carrier protein transacylase